MAYDNPVEGVFVYVALYIVLLGLVLIFPQLVLKGIRREQRLG